MAGAPCSLDGDGAVATLVRAALPAVPVVNLLPGIRKSGARADPTSRYAASRRHRRARARGGVRPRLRLPGQGHRAADLPARPRRSRCTCRLMTDPAFPFPAIGGVHLTNTITGHRADRASARRVEVAVQPENLQPHAKGRAVDFVTEVTVDGETVWEGRSTYLRRGRGSSDGDPGAGLRECPSGTDLAARRRPRPAVRRGVGRPQPDPPLPADRQGARLPAADRARHVVQGALRRGTGEPAARRGHRRRGVQEADLPAGHGRLRRRRRPAPASPSR